ncbi:hypothetical protein RI367_001122 [Sorochytrium milnesiophthora]
MALRLFKRGIATGSKPVIGFIGLGLMGTPMTSNLFNHGKDLYSRIIVHDAVRSTADKFVSDHVNVEYAPSPADVGAEADVIFTMVPMSKHVQDVYLNDKTGLINTVKKGSLLIDSSTIDPNVSRSVMSRIMQERDAVAVDAPVSGGVLGAKNATLTFMVGAKEKEHFEAVKPYLQPMGKNLVYCGKPGMGLVAKICNNMLFGTTMMAVSESYNLGIRLGMDPALLANIINTSTGRCFSSDTYNPVPGLMQGAPSANDYAGGFGISLMQKDMGLAIAAAQEAKASVSLAAVTDQFYKFIMTLPGYEKKDFSVVFKVINQLAQTAEAAEKAKAKAQ